MTDGRGAGRSDVATPAKITIRGRKVKRHLSFVPRLAILNGVGGAPSRRWVRSVTETASGGVGRPADGRKPSPMLDATESKRQQDPRGYPGIDPCAGDCLRSGRRGGIGAYEFLRS